MKLKKKLKISNLCLAFFSMVIMPCWGLDEDKYQPYHITSESMTYNRPQHIVTYLTKVSMKQGTTTLHGDKVIVFISPTTNEMVKMIAFGHPAKYSTLPDNKKTKLFAEGETIFYDAVTNLVELKNKAKVVQDKDIFTGEHIWYDMPKGLVRSASPKQQTTTVIEFNQGK